MHLEHYRSSSSRHSCLLTTSYIKSPREIGLKGNLILLQSDEGLKLATMDKHDYTVNIGHILKKHTKFQECAKVNSINATEELSQRRYRHHQKTDLQIGWRLEA